MEGDGKLPEGWIKVKSKTKPGKEYFYSKKLKVSVWSLKNIDEILQKNSNDAKGIKKTPIGPPKKSVLSPSPKKLGPAIQSKAITKKNIARDRMSKLQQVLTDEVKRGEHRNSQSLKLVKKNANQRAPLVPTSVQNSSIPPGTSSSAKPLKSLQEVSKKSDLSAQEDPADVEMEDVSLIAKPQDSLEVEEFEPMEWEDVPELVVIKEVHKVRSAAMQSTTAFSSKDRLQPADDHFIIVVDTNVLLSNIDFINEIKGKMFKGEIIIRSRISINNVSSPSDIGKGIIYIPYIVLCELDKLKVPNDNVARLARRAITFIDDCFAKKDPHVIGQSAVESARRQIIPVECGDDQILNSCLLIKETTKKLILLTNDKNLRNKAFVNKIEALSRDVLNYYEFNIKNQITFE